MTEVSAVTPVGGGIPPSHSDYIVFVDESGDHSLESVNPEYPIFVLAFCILPTAAYVEQITPAVRRLKCQLFGHDLVILHEHDIRKKTGPFARLGKDAREALLEGLTEVIRAAPMTLVAVVIDKVKHKARYLSPEHPYHLALKYGLERVHHFLHLRGQGERRTTVVCEARGLKEDKEIEVTFRRVCDGDNRDRRPYALDIVIADKRANSEGLQLADLVARPAGLHVLRPDQPNRAWDVLATKLFAGAHGVVPGNGLKVFP
ncbi:MAG: DUF3800 domain-containing protein [Betaproteobacteria bacterium]|nr:DUF3800 domain-containing protein [Betaproteobacteria bacterium]